MKWNNPTNLGKSVEVKAANRPVKIAYLVPFSNIPESQLVLDAVFYESYTRWGGAYTLLVPTSASEFLLEIYEDWIKRYDPDLIYSYVQLDTDFIERIERFSCPILFLEHKIARIDHRDNDWRSYIPKLNSYLDPVSSASVIQSPGSSNKFPLEEPSTEPKIFTQYHSKLHSRFLGDNFGTSLSLDRITNPVAGFFKTICLVPDDLPENHFAGSERIYTELDSFNVIANRKALSIAQLAMTDSSSVSGGSSIDWNHSFRIFIGSMPIDRIHFWNSRAIICDWDKSPNSLIFDLEKINSDNFIDALGQYLNKNNFLQLSGGGPYEASIHSYSHKEEELLEVRDKLLNKTWNRVYISKKLDAPVVPQAKDLKNWHFSSNDISTYKITEDIDEIVANEPGHFVYTSPKYREIFRGQWIVELAIQRHHNLSEYSNVVDEWELPYKRKIADAFTRLPAKPTIDGKLAVLPSIDRSPFRKYSSETRAIYQINLPSDEVYFKFLSLNFPLYHDIGLRQKVSPTGYAELKVSDKGRNFRGVIALFKGLSDAYQNITDKYWRSVLCQAKEDSQRPLTFNLDRLKSFLPNDQATIKNLTKTLRFSSVGDTKKFLEDRLLDSLEYLVHSNAFYKVANWRCGYCGYMNARSFDKMRISNQCSICDTDFFTPIDMEWKYEINDFVYRSLIKHSGLLVLWTLGFLRERMGNSSFFYLPEVDLYRKINEEESKCEIDFLCMIGAEFYAGEVKRSVSLFLKKEGAVDKFIQTMKMLRPNVALLSFERYSNELENIENTKKEFIATVQIIKDQLVPWTKLEVIFAEEQPEFKEYAKTSNMYGERTAKYLLKRKR